MNGEIRIITTAEAIPLRKKILRPDEPSDAGVTYLGDAESTTFHFGIFINQKICGVSTWLREPFAEFPANMPYRLRGMAVESALQGQGLGLQLLRHGVEFLKQKNCDLIWFNARETAFPFYAKLGFVTHGPLFDIKGAGPHKVMYKRL